MADRKGVTARRFRYPATAQCENCNDLHSDSTRERCRVHVQQTGHTVRFLIEDVTRYDPAEPAHPGYANLTSPPTRRSP